MGKRFVLCLIALQGLCTGLSVYASFFGSFSNRSIGYSNISQRKPKKPKKGTRRKFSLLQQIHVPCYKTYPSDDMNLRLIKIADIRWPVSVKSTILEDAMQWKLKGPGIITGCKDSEKKCELRLFSLTKDHNFYVVKERKNNKTEVVLKRDIISKGGDETIINGRVKGFFVLCKKSGSIITFRYSQSKNQYSIGEIQPGSSYHNVRSKSERKQQSKKSLGRKKIKHEESNGLPFERLYPHGLFFVLFTNFSTKQTKLRVTDEGRAYYLYSSLINLSSNSKNNNKKISRRGVKILDSVTDLFNYGRIKKSVDDSLQEFDDMTFGDIEDDLPEGFAEYIKKTIVNKNKNNKLKQHREKRHNNNVSFYDQYLDDDRKIENKRLLDDG